MDDGVILKDGTPFFMNAIYHVSTTEARRSDDLEDAAAQGFNVVHIGMSNSSADVTLADLAHSLGLYLIVEFNTAEVGVIASLIDHPAVMAWNLGDDVDVSTNPTDLAIRNTWFHTNCPRQITYVSGGTTTTDNFAGCADIVGCQSYPVDAEELNATAYLYNFVYEGLRAGGNFGGNLQCFGWFGTSRYPTAVEARNMFYQAFCFGIGSVQWYTLYDSVTDLPVEAASLWAELALINAELELFKQHILAGVYTKIAAGPTYYAYAAVYKNTADGKLLAIAVNTHPSSSQNFTLNLSSFGVTSGTQVNVFNGTRTGRMSMSGANLTGSLPSYDVQVYEVDLA